MSTYTSTLAGSHRSLNFFLNNLFLGFIYLFLKREIEEEEKGEKHQCVVASHTTPTWDLACNSGMHPDRELNQRPPDSPASTQSTEPH